MLPPTGVHTYTPYCLLLIGMPAHPSSRKPHSPWWTSWYLLSMWTTHHSPCEASTSDRTRSSPYAVGQPLTTDQHPTSENNYQHSIPLHPTILLPNQTQTHLSPWPPPPSSNRKQRLFPWVTNIFKFFIFQYRTLLKKGKIEKGKIERTQVYYNIFCLWLSNWERSFYTHLLRDQRNRNVHPLLVGIKIFTTFLGNIWQYNILNVFKTQMHFIQSNPFLEYIFFHFQNLF